MSLIFNDALGVNVPMIFRKSDEEVPRIFTARARCSVADQRHLL